MPSKHTCSLAAAIVLLAGASFASATLAATANQASQPQTPKAPAADTTPASVAQPISPASEAPKDLAILPWKNALKGELPEGQLRLVEVPLEPIDPQVFRREIKLFNQESQQP